MVCTRNPLFVVPPARHPEGETCTLHLKAAEGPARCYPHVCNAPHRVLLLSEAIYLMLDFAKNDLLWRQMISVVIHFNV